MHACHSPRLSKIEFRNCSVLLNFSQEEKSLRCAFTIQKTLHNGHRQGTYQMILISIRGARIGLAYLEHTTALRIEHHILKPVKQFHHNRPDVHITHTVKHTCYNETRLLQQLVIHRRSPTITDTIFTPTLTSREVSIFFRGRFDSPQRRC